MRGYPTYNHLLELTGPLAITQLFYAGMFLTVAAVFLLSLGRMRWLGRTLGILGVFSFMFALFLIHEQQTVETRDDHVTVTHWRYSPAVRFQVRIALLGLPIGAAFLMMQVLWSTQRRQRSNIPNYLKQGRLRLIRGDYEGAKSAFDEAVRIAPQMGGALLHRAMVFEAQGRLEDALADLDQALQADPQYAPAYLMRGRLRTAVGDLEAADQDLDRYLVMRPSDVEGYLHRGLCRAEQGRRLEAVADLQRVLKLTNHSDYADPARARLDALLKEFPEAGQDDALPAAPNGPFPSILDATPRYDHAPGQLVDQSRPESSRPSQTPTEAAVSPTNTLPPR